MSIRNLFLGYLALCLGLLFMPFIVEAGGKKHPPKVPPHEHPNPVVQMPIVINEINHYVIEDRSCDVLGVANNHQFGRNTNKMQWSVNGATCNGHGAMSAGVAQKFNNNLIHFTVSKDRDFTAVNIGINGTF